VSKRKVDTADELLSRNMDAAASITEREDQLRRTTRDLLRTRVAKCTEADGGFFEQVFCTATNLPFSCKKFVI
jgi:phosphate uptake regulator